MNNIFKITHLFLYCFFLIFEKIIYNKLLEFINANNILYENRFRQEHATNHAIMTLVEKVTKVLATGKFVVCVYLDIRKAFNSISTSILLDKLYKIGIRGNLYCLPQSYLSSRTQYVVYNECNSSTQSIEYGVPQGSILGPLLFILFSCFFTILFADDTSVFLEGKEYTKLVEILNEEFNKITIWLNANKLMINVKKKHYMIFHRAKIKTLGTDVIMQNRSIEIRIRNLFNIICVITISI